MGTRVLSDAAYRRVADKAKTAGSATFAGEERRRNGLGIDIHVDPTGFGVIRRSLCRFVPEDDYFVMPNGVAMPEETLLDGTGSLGRPNIERGLESLKHSYDLQVRGGLARYDLQIATAMFGDIEDESVLQRTQFEMDEKIAHEMTLFDLNGFNGQGNFHENPEYGIFGATFLSDFDIWRYGLRSYHHTLSDEAIELWLDPRQIERVYGEKVWEILKENGHDLTPKNLPTVPEMVQILLERTHAFFYSFNPCYDAATTTWKQCYGKERFITVSNIAHFHFYQAAVTALTEETLDLQTVEEFLQGVEVDHGATFRRERTRAMSREEARGIKRAVSHIPIGAQAALSNFNRIPLKGAKFAQKRDLWPIGEEEDSKSASAPKKSSGAKKKDKMWL